MFGIHDVLLFIFFGLLLNLTPGQDVAYIVSRGAAHGWRTGAVAALGVACGCLVHVTAAALGLSAILATSATAFSIVKFAGAGYLVWMGVTMWLNGNGQKAIQSTAPKCLSRRRIFSQGFLTNALNPKVALFFMAFLPQFVSAESHDKPLAFLTLGVIFTINGSFVNLGYAWFAAWVSSFFKRGGRLGLWLKRVAGTVFIGLGVRLALAER